MGLDMEDLFSDFGIEKIPRVPRKEKNIA